MVFAGEWNTIYAANRHLSVWPWSELVALVMRHARPGEATAQLRVLELGVGAGANIPFFASIGADFWGIDGSSVIIERLREAYPELADHFLVADFVADWPLDGRFDLIVDRGSLTHNTGADIARTLAQAKARLADGGLIVAVDLFSSAFDEYASGEPTEDHYTRCNFQRGRLAGTGLAHFADEDRIRSLFADFEIELLEHKSFRRHVPDDGSQFAAWNVVARSGKAG